MKRRYVLFLLFFVVICSLKAQPINDDPAGAIELPFSSLTVYSNVGATATSDAIAGTGMTSPTCYQQPPSINFTVTRDVWFKITVPATATGNPNLQITMSKTSGSTITQLALANYGGMVGSLNLLNCQIAPTLSTQSITMTTTNWTNGRGWRGRRRHRKWR